jgi:hypothetical protein
MITLVSSSTTSIRAITFMPLSGMTGYHSARICTNRCVENLRKNSCRQAAVYAEAERLFPFPDTPGLKKQRGRSISRPDGVL